MTWLAVGTLPARAGGVRTGSQAGATGGAAADGAAGRTAAARAASRSRATRRARRIPDLPMAGAWPEGARRPDILPRTGQAGEPRIAGQPAGANPGAGAAGST